MTSRSIYFFLYSDSTEYFEVRAGLDPSDWKSYRRRLTGTVDFEQFFIDVGGSVTLILSSGNTALSRTLNLHVGPIPGEQTRRV